MKRLWLIGLLVGCGTPDVRESVSVIEETLPNGATRVINSGAGLWSSEPAWRLIPEFTIGNTSELPSEVFVWITGLEVGSDRRIYVLDGETSELRIFSDDGRHLRTVGHSGRGPGEYTGASGLMWLSPDTLLVVDKNGGRYTLLSKEGEYISTIQRQVPFFSGAFSGAYDGQRILEHTYITNSNGPVPVLIGTTIQMPDGAEPRAAFEPLQDTIYLPVHEGPTYQSLSVSTAQGSMTLGVPFAPRSVYHVDGRGELWHGHGAEFRIIHSRARGDVIKEIVLNIPPASAASDLDAWLAEPGPARFRAMGGQLDMSQLPTTKPFFDNIYVDGDGYLWASASAPEGGAAFAAFDPTGRYLGRLEVPNVTRDAYRSGLIVIRDGRLHFVGEDEMGTQKVLVFAIER